MAALHPQLTDCPHCRVEGALVEVYAEAAVVESACRMCGFATEAGEVRVAPRAFHEVEDALDALRAWAEEEGEADLETFCEVNFAGLPSFEVALRLTRRERVETGFDVLAFLFPQTALSLPTRRARPRAAALARPELLPTLTVVPWEDLPERTGRVATAPRPEPPAPPPRVEGPAGRALWAVALADGRVDPREERLVLELCAALGGPIIPRAEAVAWRPSEVERPADPAALVAALVRVARVDGEVDRSEARLVREFARAWGVSVPRDALAPRGALESVLHRIVGGE